MSKGQYVKEGNINARWTVDEHTKNGLYIHSIIKQLESLEEACLNSYSQTHSLTLQCRTTKKKVEKFKKSLDDNFWSEYPMKESSPY
jgi:hypothetical protein